MRKSRSVIANRQADLMRSDFRLTDRAGLAWDELVLLCTYNYLEVMRTSSLSCTMNQALLTFHSLSGLTSSNCSIYTYGRFQELHNLENISESGSQTYSVPS